VSPAAALEYDDAEMEDNRMSWQRARTEEQKEQRIRELTDAAARLYESNELSDITIAMISREAGWTRSNVYKYFKTKEEVFLELLKLDLRSWAESVVEALGQRADWDTETLAVAWADSCIQQARLIDLMSVMFSVLERNSSVERLTAFKSELMKDLGTLGMALAQALPFRNEQAIADFLHASSSLLVGMGPIWNPTEKQQAAIEASGYPLDRDHLQDVFRKATEALLRGFA